MANILLYFLKKDIKSRYAGSMLGMLWAFLLPLFQILLFWFVFAGIFKARPYANSDMPYIYFLLSSIFFWLAFADGLSKSTGILVENAEIVKRVPFPNIILPVSATLSSYSHHLIGFVIFIVFYSATGSFSPSLLLILPVLLIQIVFSAGLGMIFASLLPYSRDIGQVLGYILQAAFFLSPVMYSPDLIPEKLKLLIFMNPFSYFAVSYQRIILFNEPPELSHLALIFGLSILALAGGMFIFNKLKDGFADVL